jgi:hypothetical protein
MGKSGNSTPASVPTPAFATPSVDTATLAATKALDAQGASTASQAATDEAKDKKKPGLAEAAPVQAGQPPRPKKQVDAGTMMQAPVGGMNASAVLTG